MKTDQLVVQVVKLIGEFLEVDVSHLQPDSSLTTAVPGLDSLKLFELMLYLEDRLQVPFDDLAVQKLETIGQLVSYIADRQSVAASTSILPSEDQP
jgi:acyl carrier protein